MSTRRTTRRSFIGATGVALSAPLSGLGVAVAGAASASGAAPDDISTLRSLMHEEATRLNARPEGFGSGPDIAVEPGGRSATATLQCIVDETTAIGPDCPMVAMAREQGGGTVTRTQHGAIEYSFVKQAGAWTIERATFRPDS